MEQKDMETGKTVKEKKEVLTLKKFEEACEAVGGLFQ